MKKIFAYLFYILITLLVTYGFYTFIKLLTYSIRFIAADGPPGDISMTSKYFISIGGPLFYLVILTFFLFVYRNILSNVSIKINKMVPLIVNVVVTLFLMLSLYKIVFDL